MFANYKSNKLMLLNSAKVRKHLLNLEIALYRTSGVVMASAQKRADEHSHRKSDGSRQGRRIDNPDLKLSKKLSYILRHGASKEGFELLPGGFLYVDDLLKHKDFQKFQECDVKRVVESNDKQRFCLEKDDSGKYKIRANQGHSVEVDTLDLLPITEPQKYPSVVHGTYKRFWKSIKNQGISKMKRNHVHLAPGVPGEDNVISGMRSTCDLLIYVDLEKALADGIKFYISANNVILTEGNQDGFLETKYFQNVVDRVSNKILDFDNNIETDQTEWSSKLSNDN